MGSKSIQRKLTASLTAVFVLLGCLIVTTALLLYATVSVQNNIFRTGKVAISLNNGMPIIQDEGLLFEPGMTVVKDFTIENLSTQDAWYRLYFSQVSGDLADVVDVCITHSGAILYQGKMSALQFDTANPPQVTDTALTKAEGKRTLDISFHFPEDSDKALCSSVLTFDLVAEAVQVKNNPEKSFFAN